MYTEFNVDIKLYAVIDGKDSVDYLYRLLPNKNKDGVERAADKFFTN